MSAQENTALEETVSPVAEVIPESSKSGLPSGNLNEVADKFWSDEPPKKEEKPAEKKPVVSADDAPPPKKDTPLTQSLGDKLAAKVKPKPEEKKPEAKVETKSEDPEDKLQLDPKSSASARENFEKLKGISKQARAELAAKLKEIEELKAKASPVAADHAELERLRAEHKAMSDKLLLIDTKNHPTFQAQYVKPKQEALTAATELLKANGKEADIAALIEKPRGEIGKALSEILKDVPAFDQTEISAHIQKAYQLAQAEKTALAQAGDVHSQIKKQDSTAHVQAFDKTWDKIAQAAGEFLIEAEIPEDATPERKERLSGYNADMKALRDRARQIATGDSSYESVADASIKAAAFEVHAKHVLPMLAEEIADRNEVIRKLTEELKGYRSRNPNRNISPTVTVRESKEKSPSIEDAAEAAWGKR